ncbi:YceI family protein [Flavobacterium sp. '19STA2R22 D10 B1']|uniref:YceI family protein n=1 Tax=Flavobacterium aerium TaxID=3037261 RepID=UPI00278C3FE4|nr:YceI family protein [Flavobacterium sp. '19STA2R22 D10 B1']
MSSTKWTIDPAHSEIQFKVKHLVISTVTGSFQHFTGEAVTDGDSFDQAEIKVSIETKSVDTNNEQRDGHLNSPDFFDTAKFPVLNIKTSSVKQKGEDLKIVADFTIRDVTKSIELEGEFGGIAKDGYGNVKAGLEVTGTLNRKDFGLNWNAVIEGGGLTVSEKVKVIAHLQFVKQA